MWYWQFLVKLSLLWQGGIFHAPHLHVKTPTMRREIWRLFLTRRSCNNSYQLNSPLGSFKYMSQTSVTDTAREMWEKSRRLPLLHFLAGNHVDGKNWCEMDSEKQRIESGAKCQFSHQIFLTNLSTLKSNLASPHAPRIITYLRDFSSHLKYMY